MGMMEACSSLGAGYLIDLKIPPRFLLGFTNLLQLGPCGDKCSDCSLAPCFCSLANTVLSLEGVPRGQC